MAKKKTKAKRKTAKKTKNKAGGARDPEQTRKLVLTATMIAAGVGVVGAGAYGLHEANRVAQQTLASQDLIITVAWPELGDSNGPEQSSPGVSTAASADDPGLDGTIESTTWMPASERARLLRVAQDAAEGGSPLSAEPLAEISRALLKEGWFSESPVVKRRGTDRVEVDGAWRVPAAVVRTGNRERMVSWEGVPLPLEYPVGRSLVRYLLEPSIPVLTPGRPADMPWPGDDIMDGLALLDVLDDDEALIAQVHGLDLNGGGAIEIVTDRGTRIRWGVGPLRYQPGERSTGEKFNSLRQLLDRTGRIDGGAKLIEIDGPQILIVDD